MNQDFEVSTNSKLYKFLYFCSNFFFTGWLVPRYGDSPTSRLFCLESVCTLFTTLIKLIAYIATCSLIVIYGIQNLFVFEIKDMASTNIFSLMGFMFKFVFFVLISIVVLLITMAYLANFLSNISTRLLSMIPDVSYLKLIKTYAKDKTNGICRRIVLTDVPPLKEDDE